MKTPKKKKKVAEKDKNTTNSLSKDGETYGQEQEDDFDFGGLPKDVPLKKNIGCGG